jgi:PAS domain S-box-containing protein
MITQQEIFNASILVVDDQATNIALITQLLEGAGYHHVSSTLNPNTVAELHRHHRYDLILLDLQMPEMDGFQVMEALKANCTESYLPVIVLTALPGHKLRALQAGAKDFISKPLDVVEVKTRIHNILEVRLLYKQLELANQTLEATVRKRTAELVDSEARYKCLTELASDWYWEQDENGAFTKVSGPALEILGLQAGVPSEDPVDDQGVFITGWNEDERAVLQAKIHGREKFLDYSFGRTKPDGSTQRFRVSGEPIFNNLCLLVGYRGIGVEADLEKNGATCVSSKAGASSAM